MRQSKPRKHVCDSPVNSQEFTMVCHTREHHHWHDLTKTIAFSACERCACIERPIKGKQPTIIDIEHTKTSNHSLVCVWSPVKWVASCLVTLPRNWILTLGSPWFLPSLWLCSSRCLSAKANSCANFPDRSPSDMCAFPSPWSKSHAVMQRRPFCFFHARKKLPQRQQNLPVRVPHKTRRRQTYLAVGAGDARSVGGSVQIRVKYAVASPEAFVIYWNPFDVLLTKTESAVQITQWFSSSNVLIGWL